MNRVSDLFIYAVVLSIIFTIALLDVTFYITRIVDNILLDAVPDYEYAKEDQPTDLHRIVGYSAFVTVLILMLIGLLIKKRYLVTSGAATLFLPTLTIIGIALHEENVMIKKHGEKYAKYRQSTPFLLPFPRPLQL